MNTTNPDAPTNEALPDATLLQTALCYLITRYTVWPCSGLAYTIVHRLQMLQAHPDLASLPEQRKIYYELLQHWQSIAMQRQAPNLDSMASRRAAPH